MTELLTKQTFLEKVFNYEKNKEWSFEGKVPAIIDWLLVNWEHYVGVSFLYRMDPSKTAMDLGYLYLPQEVCTKEDYEEYVKDDGSVGKRPVVDSSGNPVKDADAVAAQQQLLSDLAEMESKMTQVLIEANSVIKHVAHLKISCVGNKNSEFGFS